MKPATQCSARPPPRQHEIPASPRAEGEPVALADGRTLQLRSIHPDDAEALQRMFSRLSPDEVRMRFLYIVKALPDSLAQQLCRIDPQRELALVMADPPDAAGPELRGIARACFDPVTDSAEFSLIVQRSYSGLGLGGLLMRRLIAACRARGIAELWGDVLTGNQAMRQLCDEFGFVRRPVPREPGIVRVALAL